MGAEPRIRVSAILRWCHAQGVTTLETWLPAPIVRRRGAPVASGVDA